MKRKVIFPEGIQQLIAHFESLADPRIERTRHHPLINIIVMALCGAICGADGWEALEIYCKARLDFFSGFLEIH
jgi:DDE_Tnp_1-associated